MSVEPVLLDCTLRDGGNQNNWQFAADHIAGIIRRLDDARVDVIEVGYRGGSGSNKDPNAGEPSRSSPEYLVGLPQTSFSKLAVMVVPSVCPIRELDDLADSPISLVRIAVYPWDAHLAVPFVERLSALGLPCSVNLMALSYVDPIELREIVHLFDQCPPATFYIADSFGALHPQETTERVRLVREEFAGDVGIHVHNNLGLAAANTLAALDAGATWIDSSLCSMARGAGNLATEQAVAILRATRGLGTNIDLSLVCEAAEFVSEFVLPAPMTVAADQIWAGINDHHYYFQPLVIEASKRYDLDPREVGKRLGRTRPRSVSMDRVEEICRAMQVENHAMAGGRTK